MNQDDLLDDDACIVLFVVVKENEKTLRRAKILMQMPPFLKPRERQDDILAQDERLNPLNLTKSDYMFIDISMNIPNDVHI
jgi:hypothetical protein